MVRLLCVIFLFAACVSAYPRGYNSGYGRGSDEREASSSVSEEQGCNNNRSGYSSSSGSYNNGNREQGYNNNSRKTSSTRTQKSVRGYIRSPASPVAASHSIGPKY